MTTTIRHTPPRTALPDCSADEYQDFSSDPLFPFESAPACPATSLEFSLCATVSNPPPIVTTLTRWHDDSRSHWRMALELPDGRYPFQFRILSPSDEPQLHTGLLRVANNKITVTAAHDLSPIDAPLYELQFANSNPNPFLQPRHSSEIHTDLGLSCLVFHPARRIARFSADPKIEIPSAENPAHLRHHFQRLIRLRREPGLSAAAPDCIFENDDGILVFVRWNDAGKKILIVANLRAQPHENYAITNLPDGLWHTRTAGEESSVEITDSILTLNLAPWETRVFVMD